MVQTFIVQSYEQPVEIWGHFFFHLGVMGSIRYANEVFWCICENEMHHCFTKCVVDVFFFKSVNLSPSCEVIGNV